MSFDSIFFILFGIFSLTMGILNKGNLFWQQFASADRTNKSKTYIRVVNVTMGIVSIIIGVVLFRNKN